MSAPARAEEIQNASNLRMEAEQAQQQGVPLIVLLSRDGCHYCELVRRDYLRPLQKSTSPQNPVHIRQIHINRQTALIDFSGKLSTHAKFAQQQKISLAPVVAFYGTEGQTLAPSIVGVRIPDFYQSYLDDAISTARQHIRMNAR